MKFKLILLVLSILIATSLVAFAPPDVTPFRAILVYHNVDVDGNLDVAGTSTLHDDLNMSNQPITNIGAAGTDFGTDGSLTTAAGVTVSDGNVVVADFAKATAQTAISVTAGSVITATGSYQPLESAGAVGATLGGCAAGNAGQVVVFINTVNQTITITDTGNTVLAGNAALGQYDTLVVWCDGTRQIQVSKSDN